MAVLMTPPELQFFDSDGVTPLNGGKIYTYEAGTTTPKATYTTSAASVELDNPIILDSVGKAQIWISGSYKFVVKDSADVTISTTDNVTSFTALPASSNAYFESFSGTGSQTVFTTSDDLGTDEKAIYVWVDDGLEENVTNGAFATDTGWTKGTGWSIGSGVATAAGAISTALSQTSAVTIVEGQAYSLTYTVTRSAGGIIPSVGGNDGVERTAAGTYTEIIIGGSSEIIAFTGNSFTGTVDVISVTIATTTGFNILNPSAYTIAATTLTFAAAPATGTNNIYVSAPSLLVGAASSSAADAATSAAAAAASESAAGAYAGQLTIVSTTSLAIGTGSKVFTVGADLALSAGQFILCASDASPTVNYMWGSIASYSGTTLTVTVAAVGGSGTLADWTMYLTGERGATGATGSISDLSGVASGTITTSDKVIFDDVDDSNATKSSTVSDLLALGGLTLGTPQASTSGTSIDFTSIPAGTKQIFINFAGVSTTGSSAFITQLGDAGGIEATGYGSSQSANIDDAPAVDTTTIGLSMMQSFSATGVMAGTVTLTLLDASTFTWAMTFVGSEPTALGDMFLGSADKSLSAELDRVRITTLTGSDTFDLGKINISYQ